MKAIDILKRELEHWREEAETEDEQAVLDFIIERSIPMAIKQAQNEGE